MYELFFDGSSKHGTGYFGYVLLKDKVEIDSGYGMIGQGIKPKLAEKIAMSYGLDAFIRKMNDGGPLKVFGDCKEVIETAEKDSDLGPKIARLRDYGVPVVLAWRPRDQNSRANDLARKMIVDSRMANTLPGNSKG